MLLRRRIDSVCVCYLTKGSAPPPFTSRCGTLSPIVPKQSKQIVRLPVEIAFARTLGSGCKRFYPQGLVQASCFSTGCWRVQHHQTRPAEQSRLGTASLIGYSNRRAILRGCSIHPVRCCLAGNGPSPSQRQRDATHKEVATMHRHLRLYRSKNAVSIVPHGFGLAQRDRRFGRLTCSVSGIRSTPSPNIQPFRDKAVTPIQQRVGRIATRPGGSLRIKGGWGDPFS